MSIYFPRNKWKETQTHQCINSGSVFWEHYENVECTTIVVSNYKAKQNKKNELNYSCITT